VALANRLVTMLWGCGAVVQLICVVLHRKSSTNQLDYGGDDDDDGDGDDDAGPGQATQR
jgi:hypothetical protein